MKKLLLLFVVFFGTIVLLCSCNCKHKEYSQANCTEPSICLECGETVSNALGHTDGEWITDKEANCTEDGSKHQVCSVCEATIKSETLTKLGHTDGEWITDKEANCTEDGSKHQVCSVCEATIKSETILNFGGHCYQISGLENNGTVGSLITYTCANCPNSYEKQVEEIVVSVRHAGTSSATMNGYGSYSKSYSVSASGGYGEYQYKFEVYTSATASQPNANLTKDFSDDNSFGISYRGYENAISGYILQVTVKDEAGNQTIYRYEF